MNNIINDYDNFINQYCNKGTELIKSIEEILYYFKESPIIPHEQKVSFVNELYSALSYFHYRIDRIKESLLLVRRMNSLSLDKLESQLKELSSFLGYLKYDESVHIRERIIEQCNSISKINAFWCNQHWMNGKSNISADYIAYIDKKLYDIEHHLYCDGIPMLINIKNIYESYYDAIKKI